LEATVKLERANIARLRGIPGDWPALPIGEKGLIVYGPNGVGKSSIIDALESTIRRHSSLFRENRADGVNWDDASPHVKGGGPPACIVYGKLNGKPLSLTLGSEPATELADWLSAASAASFVLRRYMLLQFVDTAPADRYEQIEPFLNLSGFSELELGLKALVDGFETRASEMASQAEEKAQVVRQTFGLSRQTNVARNMLIGVLKEKLASATLAKADVSGLPKLSKLLADELGGEAATQKLASLGAVKTQAQQLTSASITQPMYDQVISAAAALAKEIASAAQKVALNLLLLAREHFASSSPDVCPVCEQNVDPVALLARLDERIKENEAVRQATDTLEQRLKSLNKTASKAREAYGAFRQAWELLDLGALPSSYGNAEALFGELEGLAPANIASSQKAIKASFGPAECDPSAQIAQIDKAIASIGGGARRAALADAAACVAAL
jgi:hypothetical protein